MATFQDAWLERVRQKNTVLCPNVDSFLCSRYNPSRAMPGLMTFLHEAAPYCAAVLASPRYCSGEMLQEISEEAHRLGLLTILNDRRPLTDGAISEARRGADVDALTATLTADIAEYRDWIAEAAHPHYSDYPMGLLAVCMHGAARCDPLQRSLMHLDDSQGFWDDDLVKVSAEPSHKDGLHVELYKWAAKQVHASNLAGVVITEFNSCHASGKESVFGPCAISKEDLYTVKRYIGDRLVLADRLMDTENLDPLLWQCFGRDNVIAEPWVDFSLGGAALAKQWQERLNEIRPPPASLAAKP